MNEIYEERELGDLADAHRERMEQADESERCDQCSEWVDNESFLTLVRDKHLCADCVEGLDESEEGDNLSDAQADADTLASVYGYHEDNDEDGFAEWS